MHALAAAYVVALGAVLAFGVRSRCMPWARVLLAVYLLLWAVLILTAQVLSLFSAINVTGAYIGVSLAIAAGFSLLLRRIPPERELSLPQFGGRLAPRVETCLIWFLLGTGAAAVFADIVLLYGFVPSNPDSIVYRFPRAYWYFGQGSLAHFTNEAEPRPLYYPFNGTLAYFPLLHFQLGPRTFALHSFISWFIVAATTYLFAQDLGARRVYALAAAWLICLTPNVLIQSTSTNDEIIAAAPLLAGLFFLHRWYHGREKLDFVLAAVGLSISAGTKLHVMFYWPLLLVIAATLALHHRATATEIRAWLGRRELAVFILTLVPCLIFAFSFIGYNVASAGRTSAWDFNAQLLNTPFRWQAALQTAVLYAAQIILTPLADLHIALDPADRARHYAAFTDLLAPLFSWVDNGPSFTSVFYRFRGINSPSAVAFNEQTLFIGFTWVAALLSGMWLLSHRRDARWRWGRFHLASLAVWVLAYAAMTRYIEGFSVYLGYATIVAAPAYVYAFAPVQRPLLNQVRWAVLAFIAVAHCFFAASVFFTSSPRNLIVLARSPSWPVSRGFTTDPAVQDEIGRAKAGVVSHTIAWGQPHWAFMAYHPEIRQFLASNPIPLPKPPDEGDDAVSVALRYSRYVATPAANEHKLHVYSFSQLPAYGEAVPIRIADKLSPGLTWVGDLTFATPQWVFMAGNAVETRHPGRDRFIVLRFAELNDFGRAAEPIVRIDPIIYGLGPKDDLKFRFDLKVDGKLVASTDWNPVPRADLRTPGRKSDNSVLTVWVRNDNADGHVYARSIVLGSGKAVQLSP
ncbi:MAG TPA: hypothetical protein VNR11_21285 [Xanthobacteraceae bacterium]|nr:hypothetical protein [Xanthobacteraceae bacterium]